MQEGGGLDPSTPLDPRMNKRSKTLNIIPHTSNTPDYTPSLFFSDSQSFKANDWKVYR